MFDLAIEIRKLNWIKVKAYFSLNSTQVQLSVFLRNKETLMDPGAKQNEPGKNK